MKCIPRTLKVCNDFRLEATKNSTSRIVPRLNTDGLICLAVKWMGWVGSCADMMGWVGLIPQSGGLVWVKKK